MSSLQIGARRSTVAFLLTAVVLVAVASLAGGARAAIEPPWCGTPEPDAAGRLPDGTHPGDPAGGFAHIPYYAIGCTLDAIAAQSDGRITVQVIGRSALGRDLYLVTINTLDTVQQRRD